jgi:hypothetical protein
VTTSSANVTERDDDDDTESAEEKEWQAIERPQEPSLHGST